MTRAAKNDAVVRADRALAITLSLILATVSACLGATTRPDAVRTVTVMRPVVTQVLRLVRIPGNPDTAEGSSENAVRAQLLAEHRCLTQAMYYEARGEGEAGEKAVAEVIFHRIYTGEHGNSICAVVYEGADRAACQFSFICDGSLANPKSWQDWQDAAALAARILTGEMRLRDETGGAVNYHAVSVRPDWAARLVRTVQIGNHIFYRTRVAAMDRAALRGALW